MKDTDDFEDLSELCTGPAENDGVWIPVSLYGKKRNLKVLVYGEACDSVRKFTNQKLREKMKSLNIKKGASGVSFDEEGIDDVVNDDGIDTCLARLGGLSRLDGSPLKFNGKEVSVLKSEGDTEIYKGILRGMPDLADFIMNSAKDRSNFLPQGKKN